ncbi:MAG: hypothetical protein LJE59_08400 [Chromatiaceae bacterium]|nr:hypothetical protein [Chromatiaceae bacterium]
MLMLRLFRTLSLLTLIIPLASQAVTLGEARVNSYLNQPLDAEIDLIGLEPGQQEDLRLRLANDQYFERLGIVYDRFLLNLQFDVVRMGSKWVVRVRTTRPVTEPFLDFPLQLAWRGGQMIRQYTLLLDPPRRIQLARAGSRPQSAAAAAPQRSTPTAADSGSYGPVQRGETLWPIAEKLKPAGITTRQMAMALLRANPEAFINGNINLLRAGVTLTIPPRGFIEELDPAAARTEFAAHSRSQRRQMPAVATSPRALETANGRQSAPPNAADESTEAKAIEPSGEPASKEAQLRILTERADSEIKPGSEQKLKEQLLVTMEEIESNRLTTGAIESRLARLEAELAQMQQLVELKDAQIAALQSEVSTRNEIQEAAEQAEPTLPAPSAPQLPAALRTTGPETVGAGPAPAASPAPIQVIEPVPVAMPRSPAQPWHEEYLWAVWAVLALLGAIALLLMFRRPRARSEQIPMADLPELQTASPRPYATAAAPEPADLREAEKDAEELSRERLRGEQRSPASAQQSPGLQTSQRKEPEGEIHDDISESLLDEMLDESKLLSGRPQKSRLEGESEFNDEDIASWIKELGAEVERSEPRSANDERPSGDEDIPSILTELDDQLTSSAPKPLGSTQGIHLDPIDDDIEDDTFTMSLDLARAYLEIGDQEGARDMLNQALGGARNPEHRRQIEELLQQID